MRQREGGFKTTVCESGQITMDMICSERYTHMSKGGCNDFKQLMVHGIADGGGAHAISYKAVAHNPHIMHNDGMNTLKDLALNACADACFVALVAWQTVLECTLWLALGMSAALLAYVRQAQQHMQWCMHRTWMR